MDANYSFAENVVNTKFEDLPQNIVDIAKMDILDTLGVAYAGHIEAGGDQLAELAGKWGGAPESTLIGYGMKTSAPLAALVNGTLAHSLDYDDVTMSTGHIGVMIVPTAFAVAQSVGNVSGKDFITAVVLGNDVACRLGEASKPLSMGPGWLYTPLYGVFAATAVAGKLLGLTEEQMVNAFGIAYAQAAGNRQTIIDGAISKRMAAGMSCRAGVFSAYAASMGITGAKDCFEGRFGLFNVYHGGDYKPEYLTRDLGKYFTIQNVCFKRFPSCTATETPIEATLELVKEHGIRPEDVESITVHVSEHSRTCCQPLAQKQHPRVVVDAQFSIPWTVATAMIKGGVTFDDMTEEAIKVQEVLDLAAKVTPLVDVEVPGGVAAFPGIVEIKTKDGKLYSRREDVAKGNCKKPLSWDELADKFRGCMNYGRKPMSTQSSERIIEAVHSLENVDDVSWIIELMA
ncbi:MAG: MmgE/PrpD family protein [Synergistes sp.]|nr:MmgE/PrpD family protein [Synergistes sp.]